MQQVFPTDHDAERVAALALLDLVPPDQIVGGLRILLSKEIEPGEFVPQLRTVLESLKGFNDEWQKALAAAEAKHAASAVQPATRRAGAKNR